MCWGIYHAYNGVSTKEIRDPTPDLKNAFVEEIIETTARVFLIMEYACGGELFDYIVRKDRLSEEEACRFYNQILSGMEFLHSKGVAH